jgi:hypothetical protein
MTKRIQKFNNSLSWANKLKARKNPFLAPSRSTPSMVNLAYGMGAAGLSAAIRVVVLDKLSAQWRLPMHGLLAATSLAGAQNPMHAAFGGALFYALISDSYYTHIKNSLLDSVKAAVE